MELNSDDKYYQKYLEYKQQYIMLKQLKNKNNNYNYNYNELEGGGMWETLFGKSKATLAKERRIKQERLKKEQNDKLAAEQAAAEQAAIEEAANYEGDGTYLVFPVTDHDLEDYSTIKLFNYDNTKKKFPNQEQIAIIKKTDFMYPNAYIVTKYRETYNYKFINGNTEFQNFYNEIQNNVDNIKNRSCNCSIDPLPATPNDTINTLINSLNSVINVYSSNLSMREHELANIMKQNINSIMETGEHQMYILHTLDFKEPKFNESTNVKFLEKINEEVNSMINKNGNVQRQHVDFNMIIKIKPDYETTEDYIFDKIITKDDASYTETYARINTIIANNDLDKKNKTTLQIKVPNSGRGQNRGQGQYQDQGQGTIYQYPIANAASPPPVYSYPHTQKYGAEARQQGY